MSQYTSPLSPPPPRMLVKFDDSYIYMYDFSAIILLHI